MLIVCGIQVREPFGSGLKDYTKDGMIPVRIFDMAWANAETFVMAALGNVTAYGTVVYSTPPLVFRAGSKLVAKRARIEGRGKASLGAYSHIAYTQARVTVEFGFEEPAAEAGVWAEEAAVFRTESYVLPSYQTFWADGTATDQPLAIHLIAGDISITRYNVAVFAPAVFAAANGKTNKTVFRGYPIGTIMWGGVSPKRTISTDGVSSKYTITANLKYRNMPWDYAFKRGAGWTKVYKDQACTLLLFAEYEMNGL